MKHLLVAMGALVTLSLPLAAEVRVTGIVINQSAPVPEGTNIRINLDNPGRTVEKPTMVQLQVRETPDSDWQIVKSWKHHLTLLSGKRMALDYLPARGEEINPILMKPSFQVRAMVFYGNTTLAQLERSYQANYEAYVMP